jgi:hypothetical protein
MSWYPQTGSGSVAQFPVTRSRRWRAIANNLEDGEQIMLPDTTAGQIQWKLSYQDLVNAEVQNLSNLFAASQGEFGVFTFIDPLANLLGWSEGLSQSAWQLGLLETAAGAADPLGTERAWTVANPNPGTQTLLQTLGIPGNYIACFSAYLWSSVPGTVTLQRDGTQVTARVGPAWTRACVSGLGTSGAAQSSFSIALTAEQAVNVFGLQVEVQPYPSAYKKTSAALGIYEQTYFGNDELTITTTSVGLSSCEITLLSQV